MSYAQFTRVRSAGVPCGSVNFFGRHRRATCVQMLSTLPEELQRREKRLAAIQAAKARLEAAQRGRDDERGREPGQDRNPRGGRPYKRAYGEQFHRS